ncbi:MAG: DUF4344 domain-containing metallopeptidase [Pseudomonadota bacterium]
MHRTATALLLSAWGTLCQAQEALSPFAEDVLLHVVAHEIGHALIREFDLPVLANEEIAADRFATYYLHRHLPDRVGEIVRARARSWLIEGGEETIFSEYPDDARRAGETVCFLYGIDPDRHGALVEESGMTGAEAADCRDRAPEIARSWRRILAPLEMPPGARVTEVGIEVADGPWRGPLEASGLGPVVHDLMAAIDWHSRITLVVDRCDGGATWARNGRTITICDGLIDRFEAQARR